MTEAFICDAIRTPIGRFGGALAKVRADDLAAIPLRALKERNPEADFSAVDDVLLGCANQAGEDNRNVARMAALLAGYGTSVPGTTINRLCGSGMDAVAMAARAIKTGEGDFFVAGGVESMTRAPFVLAKSDSAFGRKAEMYDTTIGWRFVNSRLKQEFGVDSMPETAENVAEEFGVSREEQDRFAAESQRRAAEAQANGRLAAEIVPVTIPQRKGEPITVGADEHPRDTSEEALAKLRPIVKPDGTITAGNASGVNDGAAAIIVASKDAVEKHGLTPRARVLGAAVAGVPPRIMGMGPAPASEKLMQRLDLAIGDFDVDRTQRGVRGPGHPGAEAARPVARFPKGEPQWRRDRAWPSPGHVGRPPGADRHGGVAAARIDTRFVHDVHRSRPGNRPRARTGINCPSEDVPMATAAADLSEDAIMAVLDKVMDPEIPVVSITDLGIVRAVTLDPPRVFISPTYTGCPATLAIEEAIREALDANGFGNVYVERVLFPPWTTDWISERGKERLKTYGIAPPDPNAKTACPQCGAMDTEEVSRFGSTPCKAQWRCRSCGEPFDRFKCH